MTNSFRRNNGTALTYPEPMTGPTTQIVQQSAAPVKVAAICLALAWVFALLPIPFISFGGMLVSNMAAFILAILCMSRNSVKSGIGVLAGSLIGTPIMYFIGLAVLASGFAHAPNSYGKRATNRVQNNPAQAAPKGNQGVYY